MSTRTEIWWFRFSVTFESCIEYKIQPSERLLFLKASLQLILIPSIAIYWLTYSFQTSSLIANFRAVTAEVCWRRQCKGLVSVSPQYSIGTQLYVPFATQKLSFSLPYNLPVQFWYIEKSKIIRLRIAIIGIKRDVRESQEKIDAPWGQELGYQNLVLSNTESKAHQSVARIVTVSLWNIYFSFRFSYMTVTDYEGNSKANYLTL